MMTFTWVPDPAVHAAAIRRVAVALSDQTVPLVAASETMQSDIRERFMTETDPSGNRWQEWAQSYAPIAAAKNSGILRQTDELMEAASSSEATMVRGDTLFYNTQLLPHYGLAHDQGLPDRKTPLPQREFLGMSDEAADVIMTHFSLWFDGAISFYPTSKGRVGRRHSFRDPEGSGQFAVFEGAEE